MHGRVDVTILLIYLHAYTTYLMEYFFKRVATLAGGCIYRLRSLEYTCTDMDVISRLQGDINSCMQALRRRQPGMSIDGPRRGTAGASNTGSSNTGAWTSATPSATVMDSPNISPDLSAEENAVCSSDLSTLSVVEKQVCKFWCVRT